jgi:hypothetical protein
MLERTAVLAWVLMIRRSSQQRVMTRYRVVIEGFKLAHTFRQVVCCVDRSRDACEVEGEMDHGRGCISGGPSNFDILEFHHEKRVDEKRVGTTIHLLNRCGICIKRSLVDGLVAKACQSRRVRSRRVSALLRISLYAQHPSIPRYTTSISSISR